MKIKLIIFLIILSPLIIACKTNNEFTQGDNIDICTGICQYQTPSLTSYLNCDSNVSCYLTSYYPNNTLISAHKLMSFNGTIFNYSLGSINTTGTYNHKILCYNQYGEISKEFISTIATSSGSITPTPNQAGYGSYSNAMSYSDYSACSYVYDFIISNYNSGKINYNTEQLNELINQINNNAGSDLNSETVINYVSNYNSKCLSFKELPTNIRIGILEEKIIIQPEKTIWQKYKYEIIFVILISLGVLGLEYLKKNKMQKQRIGGINLNNLR